MPADPATPIAAPSRAGSKPGRTAEPLRIGVPRGGRFEGRATEFLESCGLRIRKESDRQLTADIAGFPDATVVLQRARDIITQVADGKLDVGITGEDFVQEFAAEDNDLVVVYPKLGFSSGTVVIAVPDSWVDVTTLADLADVAAALRERGEALRVATSYPNLTQRFFYEKGITHFSVVLTEGGVEASPWVGFSDVVAELTVSGTSMRENRLKVLRNGSIMQSQACLIGNRRNLRASRAKRDVARSIIELIEARLRAQGYFSVTANLRGQSERDVARGLLDTAATRGMSGPTVARVYTAADLDEASPPESAWFAATIIVGANALQEAVDHMRAVGGSGISVVPVRYLFAERSHQYAAALNILGVADG